MRKVITLDGRLIHIGEWDYMSYTDRVIDNPYLGEGDAPDDWDFGIRYVEVISNPLPEGAIEEELEIVESAKGRLLRADDWFNLREDAYPSIQDQLDAHWKGGAEAEAMAEIIAAVKAQYPKPE